MVADVMTIWLREFMENFWIKLLLPYRVRMNELLPYLKYSNFHLVLLLEDSNQGKSGVPTTHTSLNYDGFACILGKWHISSRVMAVLFRLRNLRLKHGSLVGERPTKRDQ